MREVVNQIYEEVENALDDVKLFLKLMDKIPDALIELSKGTKYPISISSDGFMCYYMGAGVCVNNNAMYNLVYSPKTKFLSFKRKGLMNNELEIYNANSDLQSNFIGVLDKSEYTETHIKYLVDTYGKDITLGIVLAAYVLESNIDEIRFNIEHIHTVLCKLLSDNYRNLLW